MNSDFSTLPRSPTATGIYVGELGSSHSLSHITAAFRAEGIDVIEFDIGKCFPPAPNLGVKIVDRMLRPRRLAGAANDIVEIALDSHADFVFFTKAMGATRANLSELRDHAVLSVCWFPDYNIDQTTIVRDALAAFDLVITTKDFQIDFFSSLIGADNVFHVDHGYMPGIHRRYDPPLSDAEKSIECLYIGNHSPSKQRMLAEIALLVPEVSFVACGARWNGNTLPGNITVLPAQSGDRFTRLANHAKIALSFHHGPGGSQGWEDRVSMRTFEFPACGAFTLHIDNEEVRKKFVPGTECDVFVTPAEAAAKIVAYLEDPETRETIAENGWKRAVPDYSVGSRIRRCAEIILPKLKR